MLKADRDVQHTNIDTICDVAAEAGQVLILKNPQPSGRGVGQGIDEYAAVSTVPPSGGPPSGAVVTGLLLTDVEDIDQSLRSRKFQKTTQVVGEPVCLMTDGYVWTNKVIGTPTAGQEAFVGAYGSLGTNQVNGVPAVGRWKTSKSTEGFAKVFVRIT